MTMGTIRTSTALLLTLTLAACGGGGGGGGSGGGSEPLSTRGFAEDGWVVEQGITFSPPNLTVMITRDRGDTIELVENDTITFEFDENASNEEIIRLVIDGRRYTFTETEEDRWRDAVSGTIFVQLAREMTSENGAAELYYLFSTQAGSSPVPEGMAFVIGYGTDPATVDAQTGLVEYSGTIIANAVDVNSTVWTAPFSDNQEEGTITLFADFDGSGNVSGEFSLGNFNGDTTAETYDIPTVNINGNGFSGTFAPEDGTLAPGQTLVGAEINGNFYGSDAGAIGGSIFTQIQETGEDTIYIQGGFLADAQP